LQPVAERSAESAVDRIDEPILFLEERSHLNAELPESDRKAFAAWSIYFHECSLSEDYLPKPDQKRILLTIVALGLEDFQCRKRTPN
jgi:hypothetical protein